MEKTIGMRIRECRVKMGITKEELAILMCIKKSTISAYELDKIDIKVSIIKEIAQKLGTTVAYLVDGEENALSSEIMQMVALLQGMQNEELRKVAVEQVKILAKVKLEMGNI